VARLLRHVLAIVVLPFTVTLVIPRLIASSYGIAFVVPVASGAIAQLVIGIALFLGGVSLAVSSVLRFAFDGDGTLAPWDPPKQFVATGPYRYVRNPMITGVTLVLCAQSLILHSWPHAAWTAVFIVLNVTWIPLAEEPGLRARFGDAYRDYCAHVGRLVPRLTPYSTVQVHLADVGGGLQPAARSDGLKPVGYVCETFAVVPASGKSSRFGSDKRQALIDGVPMLQRVVAQLQDAGVAVIVVGGLQDRAALRTVVNPDPDRGMFSSIQIGLAEAVANGATVILVQPADMPFVRTETIRAVADECVRIGRAVCPRYNAKRGHPLAFTADIARQLLAIPPSTPLNEAFAAIGLVRHELDVDDPGVLKDVDVPADLKERRP